MKRLDNDGVIVSSCILGGCISDNWIPMLVVMVLIIAINLVSGSD